MGSVELKLSWQGLTEESLIEAYKRHTLKGVKPFIWDEEKNEQLTAKRGVSFEMVVEELESGRFRIAENMSKNHSGQKIYLIGFADPLRPGER